MLFGRASVAVLVPTLRVGTQAGTLRVPCAYEMIEFVLWMFLVPTPHAGRDAPRPVCV
ncbi:hypothetical protein QUF72_13150 [Desulfobacterales bacterium HSG2]|nr:hypothetical protein [Desulfobacterales bacterium HSG2]